MLNKFIDLERLATFFQGLKDIFLQKDEASTTYATKTEVNDFKNSKGQAGGIAELDNTGKVPASQLPEVQIDDLSSYATTDYVNTKNTVSVLDTRDEAYTPRWYMQNQDKNMVFEFKRRSTIGNPPENSSSGSHYSLMLTMVPWHDSSGGFPTQITFGNSIALRRGIGNTEWENWIELASMSDIPFNTSELINDSGFITANEILDVDLSNLMPKSGGVLENYREKLTELESGAINLSLGNVFTHTLTGNTTYSITNAVDGQAHSFTLIITQTATVRTLTFPASVKWQDGEIPDMSTPLKEYELFFTTTNGGGSWRAGLGGVY